VLVIPTEELEALRRPRPAMVPVPPAPQPAAPARRRRRRTPVLLLLLLLLLVGGGAAGAFVFLGGLDPVAVATPSPSASLAPTVVPTVGPTPSPSPTLEPTAEPTPTVVPTGPATPSAEPTPSAGDTFAFYEVSVGPEAYTLFELSDDGSVGATRDASFGGFSFARVSPIEGTDGEVYWRTEDGALTGFGYRFPDSGDFRIRAVFLSGGGVRRSAYLEEGELSTFPEATPAP
jgi:hypothetical protein